MVPKPKVNEMEQKEVRDYLKKNLKLSIATEYSKKCSDGNITISLLLDGEKISDVSLNGSEVNNILPEEDEEDY